jgi:hypothetical protein
MIRERIQQVTARPVQELLADDISGVGFKADAVAKMGADALQRMMPKFRNPEDVHIVVAGSDAGKFSGAFHGWATGEIGSIPVSKKIEEVL